MNDQFANIFSFVIEEKKLIPMTQIETSLHEGSSEKYFKKIEKKNNLI